LQRALRRQKSQKSIIEQDFQIEHDGTLRVIKVLRVLALTMILAVVFMSCVPVSAAKGSYPGTNGKIAFSGAFEGPELVWVMNPDGTNRQWIASGELDSKDPVWSPGGT